MSVVPAPRTIVRLDMGTVLYGFCKAVSLRNLSTLFSSRSVPLDRICQRILSWGPLFRLPVCSTSQSISLPPAHNLCVYLACACWKHVLFDRLPKMVLEQAVYIVLIFYAAHIDPRQKHAAYTKITDGMECSLLIYDSYNNKESNHVVLNNYCSHSYP